MLFIILSILSGVTCVLSRVINFALSEKTGSYQSTFFNFLTGLLGSIVLFIVSNETFHFFDVSAYSGSWWIYTGGLVGVVGVTLQIVLSGKISSFYLTLFLFVGQLFAGMIIDYIVVHSISIYQLVGGTLVLIGLSYNLWIDKREA
ncbi:MAG: DMT family transporter [bacterium]|nr:DMT family transporter [bacterium]